MKDILSTTRRNTREQLDINKNTLRSQLEERERGRMDVYTVCKKGRRRRPGEIKGKGREKEEAWFLVSGLPSPPWMKPFMSPFLSLYCRSHWKILMSLSVFQLENSMTPSVFCNRPYFRITAHFPTVSELSNQQTTPLNDDTVKEPKPNNNLHSIRKQFDYNTRILKDPVKNNLSPSCNTSENDLSSSWSSHLQNS